MAKTSKSKDLFDESAMSFGEHLEALRVHLWKAIVGLTLCVIVALFFGDSIVAIIRRPIDRALAQRGIESEDDIGDLDVIEQFKKLFGDTPEDEETPATTNPADQIDEATRAKTITIELKASELAAALHSFDSKTYPAPVKVDDEKAVKLRISAPAFAQFRKTTEDVNRPVTLNVQEAFMTYIKVAMVAGLMIASPWVFYQIWQFVAAGLYPHERKYVYIYLPVSIFLFVGGAAFCFVAVFPFVLQFLLGFNSMLEITPQIRLSEWISFALMLPLMFGISFQLPLVMLFLERISIFEANDYRQKRRLAILVIAVLSMLLTPADPMSMLLMMIPLLVLYELGIVLCGYNPSKQPFEAEPV